MDALKKALKRPLAAARAAGLPGVEEGTWYGTPGLLVRGKGLMRVKDAETLVVRCALEQKEVLMEAVPDIYFETEHYKGWPAVLVRLSRIDEAEMRQCIVRAWREVAPKALLKTFEAPPSSPPKAPATRRRTAASKRKARRT